MNYFYSKTSTRSQPHFLVSTGLVLAAVGVSLLTSDLGIVFELVGATSACALAYILPPACYIQLIGRTNWRKVLPAYATIVFGVAVMVISVVMSVTKIISGSHHEATGAG